VDYCLERFKNNTNWNLLLIIFSSIKYHSRYAVGLYFYWYVKRCLLKSHAAISSTGGICSREAVQQGVSGRWQSAFETAGCNKEGV
jgi:hypothetical protein